eukprot:TRINITY_DN1351_c0_g1_i1.p1 TRINITY_DN1351_c0_g1~~TRINITY_DN1351_c0_g1_i1.p1  ORF type:complete len:1053 (+),score=464.95 TRINITY_DN1351_c0_g1_i1:153-3311(+)
MNQTYQGKPENALKRAEELEALNTPKESLKVLYAALQNRKHRGQQSSMDILEKIMNKYLSLCVGLGDAKMSKDGLHQYKSICASYTTASPLENVIKQFLAQAEAKAREEQSKGEKADLDVDDLEVTEDAEKSLDDPTKERIEMSPWLKFLWETYKNILDIIRNNPKLENLYQEIAIQSFNFCLTFKKVKFFPKLCSLLRNHLTFLYENSNAAANTTSPEIHIETRFHQLNVAMELELWQEAFRSIEDIHTLLKRYSTLKKNPKSSILLTYYQRLSQIFWISENYVFHAYALQRYFQYARQNTQKPLSEEEQKKLATKVLLAALSIPLDEQSSEFDFDSSTERRLRMGSLLSFNNSPVQPQRDQLLLEASKLTKSIVPELQDLYETFFKFNPLQFSNQMKPKLEFVRKSEDYKQYYSQFVKSIFLKQLQQFSSVYETMKIAQFTQFTSYVGLIQAERLILDAVRAKHVSVRIDHQKGVFHFGKSAASKGTSIESTQLGITNLVSSLQTAVRLITPQSADQKQKKKEQYTKILAEIKQERDKLLQTRELMEKKIQSRLQQEKEEKRLEREKKQAQETAQRKEEEAKLAAAKEERRIKKEERERKEEALRQLTIFCESLFSQTGVRADPEDLYARNIDPETFMKNQLDELEKKNNATAKKYQRLEKRMNWFEKARREKERPLLAEFYNKHKHDDESYYKEQMQNYVKSHKSAHEKDLEEKKRLQRFASESVKFEKVLTASRKEEFDRLQAIAEKESAAKKAKQAEERERREKEEAEKRAEQERKRKLQEEEDNKKKEEEARKRKERDERDAKLREQTELQRKREEEALARASGRRQDAREDAPRRGDDYPPRREGPRDEPPRRDFARGGDDFRRSDRDEPRRGDDYPPRREEPRRDRDDYPPRRDEPRRDEPRRDDYPRRGGDEPRRGGWGRDDAPPRRDEPRRDRDDYPPRRDEPRRGDDYPPRRDEPRRDEPRRDEFRNEPSDAGWRDDRRREEPRRDYPRRNESRSDAGDDRGEELRRNYSRRNESPRRDLGPRYEYPRRDFQGGEDRRGYN